MFVRHAVCRSKKERKEVQGSKRLRTKAQVANTGCLCLSMAWLVHDKPPHPPYPNPHFTHFLPLAASRSCLRSSSFFFGLPPPVSARASQASPVHPPTLSRLPISFAPTQSKCHGPPRAFITRPLLLPQRQLEQRRGRHEGRRGGLAAAAAAAAGSLSWTAGAATHEGRGGGGGGGCCWRWRCSWTSRHDDADHCEGAGGGGPGRRRRSAFGRRGTAHAARAGV